MGEQNEASAQEKTIEGKRVDSVDHNRTAQGGHRKRRAPGEEQMELLRFFLEASPERLQVIRKTIERVEKMTPEERKSMRARLKRFQEKAPSRPIENDEGFPHETGFAEPLLENFGPGNKSP